MAVAEFLLAVVLCAGDPAGGEIPHFDTEVMPVFTKAGCNAGACHGSAAGRGGFKLSLLGGDAAADYSTIVHQLEGRRINLARPADSLLIRKPTGSLDHGGGEPLEYEGKGAKLLESWIAAGAPRGRRRKLEDLSIEPRRAVVSPNDKSVPIRVTARFDDGRTQDVTDWTVFTAADSSAVEIDAAARTATVRRGGQHVVIARFLDRVLPLQFIAPIGDAPVDLSQSPRRNFIDDHVLAALQTLRLPISPPADDAMFLRRLSLDLTGRLPRPEQIEKFLADDRADKRERLIDEMLDSQEFVEFWTWRLAQWLRIRSGPNDAAGTQAFHAWLKRQLKERRSYLEIAEEMLTATGDSHTVGPANFHRAAGDARGQAEYVSELLLGVRLRCANCHNHPLDRWTQDDYHGLAAIFARMERGQFVRFGPRGEVTHPATGEPAVPRIPGTRFVEGKGDHRPDLAAWLAEKDNPYFARTVVNRLWKAMMGRGLIEPTDDLRETNPAMHPELLADLSTDFVKHDYDLCHTLKLIAASATYARSSETLAANAGDDRFYSHALSRPLEAEVLADAIADVTGVKDAYTGRASQKDAPETTADRAVRIIDPAVPAEALDILGRCPRTESCETPAATGGGLTARLHLINGPVVNAKISSDDGRLRKLMAAGRSNEEIICEMYSRALGRPPRDDELLHWTRAAVKAASPDDRRRFFEDFCWALLNCREFSTNH
ncbi:MAG: DUF1553 domain-containing protein [Planctomycetia bacterium]|nr:DUF1553 domain-containing protein [Planctomycetia bacterium]